MPSHRRPLSLDTSKARALIDTPNDVAVVPRAAKPVPARMRAASTALPGSGWAHDRHTLAAARRGFGQLRGQCLRAAEALPKAQRVELVERLQNAQDLAALLVVHGRLTEALHATGRAAERSVHELQKAWMGAVWSAERLQPFGARA